MSLISNPESNMNFKRVILNVNSYLSMFYDEILVKTKYNCAEDATMCFLKSLPQEHIISYHNSCLFRALVQENKIL